MAIGGLIGGIIQGNAAKKAAKEQAKALAEMRARLDGISVPEAEKLVIEEMIQQGTYTPEVLEAFELPESEVAKITEDAALRRNQLQALNLIQQRAQGGLSAADRADLNTVRAQTERDRQAKQAQILQQMQSRGLAGGGAELAMQLAQAQSSDQIAAEEADRAAAQASRQAMEAAAQMAAMSGNLRNQDLNFNQTVGTAADEFNRFNVSNRQNVASTNVGNRNQAQQVNLSEQQRIADANTAARNAEQIRYQQAKQQQFQNELSKATGVNQVNQAQGDNAAKEALAKGQMTAGLITGIGDTVATALTGGLSNLPNLAKLAGGVK